MHEHSATLVKTWIALLALLALTAVSAWLPLGSWNSIANLGIAVLKTLLVALVFMRAASSGSVVCMVAITAIATLLLLLVLSGADFFTRRIYHAPYDQPPRATTQSALLETPPRTDGPAHGHIRFQPLGVS
jgi:cytochrome c oxidase subunit 4